MKKLALVALAALVLLAVPPAWAQNPAPTPVPTAVPRGTIISQPANNETVRGRVRIFGSAWVDNFQRYEVYYNIAGAQQVYRAGASQPVINGLIYEWNTAGWPDGNYVIIVRAVKADGNYSEARVTVRLDNSTPPTPTAVPTEGASATPEPTRTMLPAASTATPQRTATPVAGAVVPTPSGGLLSGLPIPTIDPTACLRPLILGGILSAGLFLVFGLLAIVKRLLGG